MTFFYEISISNYRIPEAISLLANHAFMYHFSNINKSIHSNIYVDNKIVYGIKRKLMDEISILILNAYFIFCNMLHVTTTSQYTINLHKISTRTRQLQHLGIFLGIELVNQVFILSIVGTGVTLLKLGMCRLSLLTENHHIKCMLINQS